jgi:hypothetical protein
MPTTIAAMTKTAMLSVNANSTSPAEATSALGTMTVLRPNRSDQMPDGPIVARFRSAIMAKIPPSAPAVRPSSSFPKSASTD